MKNWLKAIAGICVAGMCAGAAEVPQPVAVGAPAAEVAVAEKAQDAFFTMEAEKWNHKVNTTVESLQGENGEPVLRVSVKVGDYMFGWFSAELPPADYGLYVGLAGRFRIARGHGGGRLLPLIILPRGDKRLDYRVVINNVDEGEGQEWVEFFCPFADMEPSRDAPRDRNLSAGMLQDKDSMEIQITGLTEDLSVDFTGLRLVPKEGSEAVVAAFRKNQIRRQLLPESRISTKAGAHPRLLLNEKRLARIRAMATAGGDSQVAYETFLARAEVFRKSFNADEPFKKVFGYTIHDELNGHRNRARFEGALTPSVRPIEVLAAAGLITGDESYCRQAAKGLVNMAKSLDVQMHEIDQGFYYTRTFYVRALAFGYDWLWKYFTPEERMIVKTTLLGFVNDIYDNSWQQHWGKHPLHRVWNWNPGLMSCAGLGLLAMEGETRLPEMAMLFEFKRHLRDYLTLGIDFDGCGHEGPSYIAYGIGAGPEFMECLREQGRGDLFTETNFHLIPPWLIGETLPSRKCYNNLSDCPHGQVPGRSVYTYAMGRFAELAKTDPARKGEKLAAQADALAGLDYQAHFSDYPGKRTLSYGTLAALMGWAWQCGSSAHNVAGWSGTELLPYLMFFQDCPPIDDPASVLPGAMFFRGRGLVAIRDGYGLDGIHLEIEAGPHAAGHDQADKGNFTLRGYGVDYVIDSGYGNDGEKFKSGSSYAHNVVLVDGEGQPCLWHNNSNGEITGFHHSDSLDWVRADALDAWNMSYSNCQPSYSNRRMAVAERQFAYVRAADGIVPYLVLFDDICKQDGKEHDYTWQWHYPTAMTVSEADGCYTGAYNKKELVVLTTDPDPVYGVNRFGKGTATFTFEAPADGDYQLAGYTCAAGEDKGKSDSFSLVIGDQHISIWDTIPKSDPAWVAVKERDEGQPRKLTLRKGETLTVQLVAREPQTCLAYLLLMPYGADLPLPPAVTVKGGVVKSAAEAVLGEVPLLRREMQVGIDSEARIVVYPAGKGEATTATGGFLTSQEGTHTRLQRTVRAVNPEFTMVMVPQRTAESPLPLQVKTLAGDVPGVEVVWAGDRVDRFEFVKAPRGGDRTLVFTRSVGGKVTDSWRGMEK